jgi:cysteinyl-tRNA synthetase
MKDMTENFDIKTVPLKFFNTESKKKEVFKPLGSTVKLYTCGPTVYNFAHIGNFRTYVFEDLLRKTLKFFQYPVEQVMNLTDVDDKTIKGAVTNGVSLDAFTKTYKKAFFEDIEVLGIEKVEHYPAATNFIQEMIAFINTLLDKGYAYRGKDGSIYYSIAKFGRYGCLSHLKLDELQAGASNRVAQDEYDKDHLADFVLWKAHDATRDGDIFWESPFGPGRPGWHLECSTMAMQILGETIDIHVGGVDNIFPHHENEIAQSEACSGKTFARFWLHSEHLLVNNKKMSKSLGNFYTLRDLLSKGYSGRQIRYMLLQTHYKTQLNFTFEELDAVKRSLERLDSFVIRLKEIQQPKISGKVEPILEKTLLVFAHALADDLNISVALASIFDLVNEVNALADRGEVSSQEAEMVRILLERLNTVLGIFSFDEVKVPNEVLQLLEQREAARKGKNWALADEYRKKITDLGYVIEDTSGGARVKLM